MYSPLRSLISNDRLGGMLASFCLLWKGALFRPKGCDFLLYEIQKNGEMTVIAQCNDVCQCSLIKADSVLLTKHGGMEWGFELSSATLAVISCYEEMVIVVIPLKCFWHWQCMKRTGNFVLFIVKELSLFPLAQSVEPLMSKVLLYLILFFTKANREWNSIGHLLVSEHWSTCWGLEATLETQICTMSQNSLFTHIQNWGVE